MGLLDDITGAASKLLGGTPGADSPTLVSGLLAKFGGLQGIVTQLQASGFGDHVNSWLSNSQNLPISADQLRSALGNEQVQQIAQHFGLPVNEALTLLAQHVPAAVDQASPAGELTGEA
jgi:uncharacterized protein YidB (DUF937 family)